MSCGMGMGGGGVWAGEKGGFGHAPNYHLSDQGLFGSVAAAVTDAFISSV